MTLPVRVPCAAVCSTDPVRRGDTVTVTVAGEQHDVSVNGVPACDVLVATPAATCTRQES